MQSRDTGYKLALHKHPILTVVTGNNILCSRRALTVTKRDHRHGRCSIKIHFGRFKADRGCCSRAGDDENKHRRRYATDSTLQIDLSQPENGRMLTLNFIGPTSNKQSAYKLRNVASPSKLSNEAQNGVSSEFGIETDIDPLSQVSMDDSKP